MWKPAGELDQLLQVLEPVLGGLCLALAQHCAVAGRIQQQRELIGERRLGVPPDASDCVREGVARRARLRRKRHSLQGGEQRHLAPCRFHFQYLHRLGAEAAHRNVDNPTERFICLAIVRGGAQSQERECILDLGTLIEADVAHEGVSKERSSGGGPLAIGD